MFPGIPEIVHESKVFEQGDALLAEIKSFLHSIANQSVPLVPGEDGLVALETAEHITSLINKHLLERYA